MSDVYKTFLCTAANVDTIRSNYPDYVSMAGELTSNAEASPPPTHYFSAGFCDTVGITAMTNSGLFTEISSDTWPVVAARNNLVRVEYVE